MLNILNATTAFFIVVIGAYLFAAHRWGPFGIPPYCRPPNRGTAYSALLFGCVGLASCSLYIIRYYWVSPPLFLQFGIDAISNGLLLSSAYAMSKGVEFHGFNYELPGATGDLHKRLFQIWAVTAAVVVWDFVFGMVLAGIDNKDASVLVYMASPNIVLSANALVALGLASQKAFPRRANAFFLLMITYAILQVPAYAAFYFGIGDPEWIKGFLAVGKVLLAVGFLVLFLPESTGRKYIDAASRIATTTYAVLSFAKEFLNLVWG